MSSTIVLKRSVATANSSAATSPNPKSVGKNKTSAAAAAAGAKEPPSRQAAYGCSKFPPSHIKVLLEGPKLKVSVRESYISAIRLLAEPNQLNVQTCTQCNEVLTRTMLCLQCSNVACPQAAHAHSKTTRHVFAIDSKSASMYCFWCSDFIYDPYIEKTRLTKQAEFMEGNIRKKRKLDDAKSSPEDLKYIETNTTSAPCRATGLRGFYNMGATCFMSVVLQSLIHNPIMRNFYLSDGHRAKECVQVNCMSCAVEEIFAEFFTSDKVEGFGPTNLLITSWKCDAALAGCKQQDAHEYLQFLLNQLHITNGGITDNTKTGSCNCIIHRCFYGKLQSDVTCGNCHNVTTALDPVMDLSLELKPKDKLKKGQANGAGSDSMETVLTLQECLERFTTPEKLGIEYNCVKCSGSSLQEATKQLSVKRLPPVLCIQLKRFEHSSSGFSKIDTKVRFPAELDMTPYITPSKRKPTADSASIPATIPVPTGNSKKDKAAAAAAIASNAAAAAAAAALLAPPPRSFQYDLMTVVVHDGQIDTGHYYSYSKSGGQWFKFNDSVVSAATEAQVLAEKAYLLFYIVKSLSTST